MILGDRDRDTICAISTPPGLGGISIIRISGERSLEFSKKLAPFIPQKTESHKVFYGLLKSFSDHNQDIDEVLITYFNKGRSFTGEDTVEVSCHGNPIICERIIKSYLSLGCRVADPGEFTYRAFMNGRIDLVQAESVLSLIESQSQKAAEISLQQLKGGISSELISIEDDLTWLLANLEASIDFSTEDIEVVAPELVVKKLDVVKKQLSKLLDSYHTGKKVLSGYQVTFVGSPNVGKSSLLNNLLKEDRAIVSNIPGTTRDVVQDQILIDGVQINFSDTAGLRDTDDIIESIGVKKSISLIEKSDLIFAVFDSKNPDFDYLLSQVKNNFNKVIFIGNKEDLIDLNEKIKLKENLLAKINYINENNSFNFKLIFVSAFNSETCEIIKKEVSDFLIPQDLGHSALLSQTRHFDNLNRAYECILRASQLINSQSSFEFITLELKDSLMRVQETLGKRYDDEILDRIFKEFCLGK